MLIKRFKKLFIVIIVLSLCWFCKTTASADEVRASAAIDVYQSAAGKPIKGSVTVEHSKQDSIDERSFKQEGQPLEVQRIKSVPLATSRTRELTIYQFTLPEKEAGLYLLPQITLTVGGKEYTTIPSSYEVVELDNMAIRPKGTIGSQTGSADPGEISLETFFDGPALFFPGQQANIGYRIRYKGQIELSEEQLPLLAARGLKKIGEVEVKEYQEGAYKVEWIQQRVEAVSPGTYNYQPARLSGFVYRDQPSGIRRYSKPKLTVVGDPLTIQVSAFPNNGKPTSFQGAVGDLHIQTQLLTPLPIVQDQKLELAIDIVGRGDMNTVKMPKMGHLLPFFRLSDLPPREEVERTKKRFIVELYPLDDKTEEIAEIPFASYDPQTESYVTSNSKPISLTFEPPIKIEDLSTKEQVTSPISQETKTEQIVPEKREEPPLDTVVNQPVPAPLVMPKTVESAESVWLKVFSWLLPFLVLGGALLLFFARRTPIGYGEKTVSHLNSATVWHQFQDATPGSPSWYQLMHRAFLLKLQEKGWIASADIDPDQLPQDGGAGRVRELLQMLDRRRFSGENKPIETKLMEQINVIYKEL